jgi:hypothetical protein
MKKTYANRKDSAQYGFCFVRKLDADCAIGYANAYLVDDAPFFGFDPELFHYMSESFDWIPREGGHFQRVPADYPVIVGVEGFRIARTIFSGWLQIFSCSPDPIEVISSLQPVESDDKIAYTRAERMPVLGSLQKLIEATSSAEAINSILAFNVRY